MFTKIPTEIIKSKQISNLEFRVLSVLIMISSYNNGHSYFGSFRLSDMCGIGRVALRKALNNLVNLHLVTVTQRGSFSRSNDIFLTLQSGIEFLQSGGIAKKAPTVDLNDSPSVDLNDSRVDLNDSRVDLNDSPIKIKDLNNLNLNNKNTVDLNDSPDKTNLNHHIAPADVAAGLSMPCGEQVAAKNLAKEECAGAQAAKIQALLPVLNEYFGELRPWIQIFEVNNKIGIRVLGGRISGVDLDVVKGFAARQNIIFSQQQYAGERIIAA